MANEKDITEMSDDEILAYLNSLEDDSDDDDISDEEESLKENNSTNLGVKENSRRAERMHANSRRVFEIKNSYVSNNRTTDLYVALDKTILTEIILIKTNDLQKSMDNAKKYVTKKIESCLNKKIPIALKVAYKMYRQAFISHQGFLYTASSTYGGGKLWIVPDIPYYFEQFSEVGILYKYYEHVIHLLDRNVQLYHKQAGKLLKLETKIATKLNRVKNLIGLLELDVDMYDLYLKIQKERLDKAARERLEEQESKLYKQRYLK